MTQEEKKLLYKDLSARQSYRPFVCFAGKVTMPFLDVIATTESNELISINCLNPEDVKPYLRPMSSMTEEESKEFAMLQTDFYSDGWLYPIAAVNMVDWLNANHFDFRGLIPMGLALEAPEGMYKTE